MKMYLTKYYYCFIYGFSLIMVSLALGFILVGGSYRLFNTYFYGVGLFIFIAVPIIGWLMFYIIKENTQEHDTFKKIGLLWEKK